MKKSLLLLTIFSSVILAACNRQASTDMYNANGDAKLESYSDSSNTSSTLDTTKPQQQQQSAPAAQKGSVKNLQDFEQIDAQTVVLKTTKGEMTLELYREDAPVTTANFLNLIKSGFYDGIVFHRVIDDFMAQVGDPLTKDETKKALWGTGGPGYTIPDEFNPNRKHDGEGILSMANTGRPNTGGSQIFITFGPTPWLDGKHTVFGKVTDGLEVLRSIEQGDKIISASYK